MIEPWRVNGNLDLQDIRKNGKSAPKGFRLTALRTQAIGLSAFCLFRIRTPWALGRGTFGAARTFRATRPALTPGATRTTGLTATSVTPHSGTTRLSAHARSGPRKLNEFRAVQFAVAIGVKCERFVGETLRIHRSAWFARWATFRTARWATSVFRRPAFSVRRSRWASVWTARWATSALRWPAFSVRRSWWPSLWSASLWSARRWTRGTQFFRRQLSVCVGVQFLQSSCCVGDLLSRDFSVAIRIECFDERIGEGWPAATCTRTARTFRATWTFRPAAIRGTSFLTRRLSGHNGQPEHCGDGCREHPVFQFHRCTFLQNRVGFYLTCERSM
jgi:hypothetical protein